MKIAVCLFGHLRTYEKCYKSIIENIIKPNNADVFMHTWDTLESGTISWHKLHTNNREISTYEQEKIKDIYTLKEAIFEKQTFYKNAKEPYMGEYNTTRYFDPVRNMI